MISKSQFDDDLITVSGLPWCATPKTVGLSSLVAKNLCRRHNLALSPADNEARRLKEALKIIYHAPVLPVRVRLDARLVERWLLKTTINLALQGSGSCLDLRDEVVARAFGRSTTPRSQGFFAVVPADLRQTYEGPVGFESLHRKVDGKLVAGIFNIHGWRALYAFDGAPPIQGAMRIRRWLYEPHRIWLRWTPELEVGDTRMRAASAW